MHAIFFGASVVVAQRAAARVFTAGGFDVRIQRFIAERVSSLTNNFEALASYGLD